METIRACIRVVIALMTTLTASVSFALAIPDGGSLLFQLDATAPDPQLTLAGDTVLGWGPFALMNTNNLPPILTSDLGGVQAVRFYDLSDSILRSAEPTPVSVTGGNAWTIEAWYYAPTRPLYNSILSWGDDQADNGRGQAVAIVYGNDAYSGAARHGTDVENYNLSYADKSPSLNNWHLLALTYSGDAVDAQIERVYVDGVLINGRGNLTLNVLSGTHFHLGGFFRAGAGYFIQRCSGALARVRLYSGALTYAQVIANYEAEATDFGLSALPKTVNVFEGAGAWTTDSLWSVGSVATADQQTVIIGHAAIDDAQTAEDLNVAGTLALNGSAAVVETVGSTYVGYGTGALRLSDGATFTSGVANDLGLAVGYHRQGAISVTNAFLDVTAGDFALGKGLTGYGCADFHNATNFFKDVYIGYLDSLADLYQTNGTFESSGFLYVGEQATGQAIFEDTDITVNGNFVIGRNANGNGNYIQRGGSLKIYGTDAVVAIGGTIGNANHAQGKMTITDTYLYSKPDFVIGNARGAFAATNCVIACDLQFISGNISGSKGQAQVVDSQITADHIYAGKLSGSYGELSFVNSVVTSRYFRAGYESASTGFITMANCSAVPTADMHIGYNGHGVFSNLSSTIRSPTVGVSFNASTASGYLYNGPDARIETSDVFQIGRYGSGMLDCYGSICSYGTRGLYIGNLADAKGVFNLYPGGSVSVQQTLVLGYTAGSGTYNQYGGQTVVTGATYIAYLMPASQGTLTLHNGTYTANNAIFCGRTGTGVLHIAGGILSIPANSLTIGYGENSSGECLLTGGRLTPSLIKRDNGIGALYFDGGTLSPPANQTDFIRNLTRAEIRAGGAKINTDGYNITIAQSIAHDTRESAPAKDGGLTKLGAGTLKMTGTLGFTGDLGANGGSLDLSTAAYALASGAGLWGNGTFTPPTGGFSIPANGWIAPGDTDGTGTLTVNGNLTVNGTIRTVISADSTTCGTLAVDGTLLFPAGSALVIQNPEDMAKGKNYTFLTATSINGTPAIESLPRLWSLQTEGNRIRAVYISGTMISLR